MFCCQSSVVEFQYVFQYEDYYNKYQYFMDQIMQRFILFLLFFPSYPAVLGWNSQFTHTEIFIIANFWHTVAMRNNEWCEIKIIFRCEVKYNSVRYISHSSFFIQALISFYLRVFNSFTKSFIRFCRLCYWKRNFDFVEKLTVRRGIKIFWIWEKTKIMEVLIPYEKVININMCQFHSEKVRNR